MICLDCFETWCVRCGRQYGKIDKDHPAVRNTLYSVSSITNGEPEPNPIRCPECGSTNVKFR